MDLPKTQEPSYKAAQDQAAESFLLHSDSNGKERRKLGVVHRLLPMILLCVPLLVSIVIALLRVTHYTDHGSLYDLTINHRATMQVLIHVISSMLSSLGAAAVCLAINFSARQYLVGRSFSLNQLRLVAALSKGNLDLNLPFALTAFAALFCALVAVPGWLWTGALTPQISDVNLQGVVVVPRPGHGTYDFLPSRGFWSWQNTTGSCWQDVHSNGSFTNCPAIYKSGDLIQSGASASAKNGTERYHSKMDKTMLSYIGRSYGVGASAGLALIEPEGHHKHHAQGYQYREDGYLTTAKCIRNETSAWGFDDQRQLIVPATWPSLFTASGLFPNSNWDNPNASYFDGGNVFFGQSSFGEGPDWIVSLGSINGWNVNITDYYLAIAAGSQYSELDKLQCQLFFQPITFNVELSEVNNTLQVTPEEVAKDIDPSGKLRANVMLEMTAVSMVETTTYVSALGEALKGNIANVHNLITASNTRPSESDILIAVKEFVLAMTDNILEMLVGAALSRAGQRQLRKATFTIYAVEFGAFGFTVAIFVLNVVALVALIAVAVKWKAWSNLTRFGLTDPGALSCAVFLGGPRRISKRYWRALDRGQATLATMYSIRCLFAPRMKRRQARRPLF